MASYYNDVVIPAMDKERIPMKLEDASTMCRYFKKGNCFSGDECKQCHSVCDLKKPDTYNQCNKKKKGGVNLVFPDNSRVVTVFVPFNECYSTPLMRACIKHNLDTNQFVAKACTSFWRTGLCEFWWNCKFMHVSRDAEKRLKVFMCKDIEEECSTSWICRFAHHEHALRVPETFESRPITGLKGPVQVWNGNSHEFVDQDNVCYTKALTMDRPKTFCMQSKCDRWENCAFVHLKKKYWETERTTVFPVPAYFMGPSIKATIVSPAKSK